jgi:hypothetical protein
VAVNDDEDDGVERHARRTDPDTSHITARLVKMNEQRYRVLGAYYRHQHEMLDHEAYELINLQDKSGWTHQRCSDLRHAGWIKRTGNKGTTPSLKPAHKCAITPAGIRAYEAWTIIYGGY